MERGKRTEKRGRLHLLDTIRGITLISMIAYHLSWDLVYIVHIGNQGFILFYESRGGWIWQQSICWSFIMLSGFCIPLSVHKWKRGLTVYGAGILVTAVTCVFLYEDRVIFGVLTFIGSAMLIMALCWKPLWKIPAGAGVVLSAYLFYFFRWVNSGYLQLIPGRSITLPRSLYHGMAATYLGFMEEGFYSTDYFSLLPWLFLYLCGFYLNSLMQAHGGLERKIMRLNIRPFSFLGRHSLLIYLLHQPVIYMCCVLYMNFIRR